MIEAAALAYVSVDAALHKPWSGIAHGSLRRITPSQPVEAVVRPNRTTPASKVSRSRSEEWVAT
jgi:hypothetical protein